CYFRERSPNNSTPGAQFIFSNGQPYNPWPLYKFTGHLRPWPTKIFRIVPQRIPYPYYATSPNNLPKRETQGLSKKHIPILSSSEVEKMRKSGQIAREVLDEVSKIIQVGVTTEQIDQVVHEVFILNHIKGLGYPKSVCTSINEVVCHGIPDARPLQDGDIINVDVTIFHDGFHGDLSETFPVGNVSQSAIKLLKVTQECLVKAIQIVKPGTPYREIGNVIDSHASENNFSVVRDYTGHGINRLFHCAPTVYHCLNKKKTLMEVGHTFTIEPMINEGTHNVEEWPDNWTVVTLDGKLSAQFEQTLTVTENGCEVLTARKENPERPYFLDQLNQN
ncbi:hypothetical protein HZS_6887, partial [Henneguya salminicola]